MPDIFDEKNHKKTLKDLQELGLSEKEAKVYLALLYSGEVGSSKIIRDTKLHGQFVYDALRSLQDKYLIQEVTKKGRKKFSAKNPRILSVLVAPKQTIAEHLAEELQMVGKTTETQSLELFQGSESYKIQEFHLLQQTAEGSEICIIGGTADQFTRILGLAFNEYEKIRNAKGISIRYIGNQEQRHELNVLSQARQRFSYKILPGTFSGMLATEIFPHAVIINIYSKLVSSISLRNQEIVNEHKQFFETLWNIGAL